VVYPNGCIKGLKINKYGIAGCCGQFSQRVYKKTASINTIIKRGFYLSATFNYRLFNPYNTKT